MNNRWRKKLAGYDLHAISYKEGWQWYACVCVGDNAIRGANATGGTWQDAVRTALEQLAYQLDSDVEIVAKEIIKYT